MKTMSTNNPGGAAPFFSPVYTREILGHCANAPVTKVVKKSVHSFASLPDSCTDDAKRLVSPTVDLTSSISPGTGRVFQTGHGGRSYH